jgi:formylglycine-generating enzyme required for sulfatase activity
MVDVFIAYKAEEREAARKVALALERFSISTFIDSDKIEVGQQWLDVLTAALNDARCVIVLWSEAASQSDYVKSEAERARSMQKYVPVEISPFDDKKISPPLASKQRSKLSRFLELDTVQGLDDPEFRKTLRAAGAHLGRPGLDTLAQSMATGDEGAKLSWARIFPGDPTAKEILAAALEQAKQTHAQTMARIRQEGETLSQQADEREKKKLQDYKAAVRAWVDAHDTAFAAWTASMGKPGAEEAPEYPERLEALEALEERRIKERLDDVATQHQEWKAQLDQNMRQHETELARLRTGHADELAAAKSEALSLTERVTALTAARDALAQPAAERDDAVKRFEDLQTRFAERSAAFELLQGRFDAAREEAGAAAKDRDTARAELATAKAELAQLKQETAAHRTAASQSQIEQVQADLMRARQDLLKAQADTAGAAGLKQQFESLQKELAARQGKAGWRNWFGVLLAFIALGGAGAYVAQQFVSDEQTVSPPPPPALVQFVWSVQMDQSRRAIISGVAPDDAFKNAMRRHYETAFTGGVEDISAVANTAVPHDWEKAAEWAIRLIAKLETGAITYRTNRFAISGVAATETEHQFVVGGAREFQPPFSGEVSVSAAAPAPAPAPEPPPANEARKLGADCDDCPVMVRIPGGNLPDGTKVRPFAISATEVTRKEFRVYFDKLGPGVTNTGCLLRTGGDRPDRTGFGKAVEGWIDNRTVTFDRLPEDIMRLPKPAVCVSHRDAVAYAHWLSSTTGVPGYTLPSPEQWEYAARAGNTQDRPWAENCSGSGPNCPICRSANFFDQAAFNEGLALPDGARKSKVGCDDGGIRLRYADYYEPNAFGLQNMLGNAAEWTTGCLRPGESRDGYTNKEQETVCPTRGGSWIAPFEEAAFAWQKRTALRLRGTETVGFRVVRPLKPGE